MPHYKDANNELFWFDTPEAAAHLVAQGHVEITDAEAKAIIAAIKPIALPSPTDAAGKLAQLDTDNHLTQRNLREFILLTAKAVQQLNPGLDLTQIPGIAKVAQVEAQAAALRATL